MYNYICVYSYISSFYTKTHKARENFQLENWYLGYDVAMETIVTVKNFTHSSQEHNKKKRFFEECVPCQSKSMRV